MSRVSSAVANFEAAFADYVGASYAIALCNGTATLHTALVALGVRPGDRVAVPPLTMSSTTIAVLHAGAVPVYVDVEPDTWLFRGYSQEALSSAMYAVPVSLYGLHYDGGALYGTVDDAAQTLRSHNTSAKFTSYSFQASKILPLGEGGMLVTNDETLARAAREFSSLGYRMDPRQPRINKHHLKHPRYNRHWTLGWNYRMSEIVAYEGIKALQDNGPGHRRMVDVWKDVRQDCADLYRAAVQGCEWLTPQYVPDGWHHDYWTYAVATDTPERALWLLDAMERHGGERPYPAWRLTYQEPAFRAPHGMNTGTCPVAESLQPRLVQFQTNDFQQAKRNAHALRRAIDEGVS